MPLVSSHEGASRILEPKGQSGSDRQDQLAIRINLDRRPIPSPGGEGQGEGGISSLGTQDSGPRTHHSFVFKSGSQSVEFPYYLTKWYDKKRRKHFRSCTFVWKDGDIRKREKRSTVERAKKRAAEIATAILDHRVAQANFTEADRAAYRQAQESSRKSGKSVVTICASYADMADRLPAGFTSIEQIFDIGLRNAPAGAVAKTTVEIFAEMIPARQSDGLMKNTIDELSSRLRRFTKDFPGPILSITSKEITDWLRTLKHLDHPTKSVANKTRNHFRSAIGELYRYARQCGYAPKAWNPIEEVPTVKLKQSVIETFTPEEVVRLLFAREKLEAKQTAKRTARKTLMPYLATAFFAGVRHEEMSAPDLPTLDWRQVDFEDGTMRLLPEVARKKGYDRVFEMQPNLVAWLKPYAKRNGPICELADATKELAKTAEAAGVLWKTNGPRKTFISSRLAVTKNIGLVADEAGTSPDRIRHNYKKTLPKREAERHFNIWPTGAWPASEDILQVEFSLAGR